MKITEENRKENPAMHREEITFKIKNYEKTPSRRDVLNAVSAETGLDKELLVIDKIKQEYGKKEAACEIKAYESKEHKEKYSKKYKTERVGEEPEEPEEEEGEDEEETKEEEETEEGEE